MITLGVLAFASPLTGTSGAGTQQPCDTVLDARPAAESIAFIDPCDPCAEVTLGGGADPCVVDTTPDTRPEEGSGGIGLPGTGASSTPLLIGAGALLVFGGAMTLATRRRAAGDSAA